MVNGLFLQREIVLKIDQDFIDVANIIPARAKGNTINRHKSI